MKLINVPAKLPGQQLEADEVNIIVDGVNLVDEEAKAPSFSLDTKYFIVVGSEIVDGKAVPIISLDTSEVGGGGGGGDLPTRPQLLTILQVLPDENLPPVYFNGLSGTGTANDPYIVSNVSTNITEALKALPGYDETTAKLLYGGGGSGISWGPIPTGSQDTLGSTLLILGAASVNSIPLSWDAVVDAQAYLVQRASNALFTGAITVYTGPATTFAESTLSANTQYWYRVRATAAGFTSGPWATGSKSTLEAGNITPAAPTAGVVNDTANTFNWTNNPNYVNLSDYEFALDGGTAISTVTAKPIIVGNVALAAGQVCVRVKAAAGRDASPWLRNVDPFTVTLVTPGAPTNGIVDDNADTWTVTPPSGYTATDLETSVNSGTTYTANTSASFDVGNTALGIGVVKTRVKGVSGVRNPGPAISNTVPFTVSTPKYMTGFTAIDLANGLVDKTGTTSSGGIWTTPSNNDNAFVTKYTMPHLSEYAFKFTGNANEDFEMKLASSYSISSGSDGVGVFGGKLRVNRNGTIEEVTAPQQPLPGDWIIVRYVGDTSTPFANRELLLFKSSDGVTYTPITITDRILYVNAPKGYVMANIGYNAKSIYYPQGKGLVLDPNPA